MAPPCFVISAIAGSPFVVTAVAGSGHVVATRPPSIRAGTAADRITRPRNLEATAAPWYPSSRGEGAASRSATVEAAVAPCLPVSTHDAQPGQGQLSSLHMVSMEDAVLPQADDAAATSSSRAQDSSTSAQPSAQLSVAAVSSSQLKSHPIASTSHPACPSTAAYSERCSTRCNSVTIKAETQVKGAAGAIVKVLDRIFTLFVTALRSNSSHEALNRAVKSLAVARQYICNTHEGWELSFLPLLRTRGMSASNCEVEADAAAVPDGSLFAFLVFKTVIAEPLKLSDETDLNVSRTSDVNKMANAIFNIVLDRGQAVMKAGGADTLRIAMSAVINARHRLCRKHGIDIMMIPAWISEDTTLSLGRVSKFLRFNILKCPINGPMEHTTRPVLA